MKRFVAIAGLVLLLEPFMALGQGVVTVTDVGWWTRRPAALPLEGGFELASAPDGEISVAALRVASPPGLVDARITLLEGGSSFGQDEAGVLVCPAADDWTAEDPGSLQDAPDHDCTNGIELTRDADFSAWKGSITPLLLDAGQHSLVLFPVQASLGYQLEITSASIDATATAPSTPAPTVAPATFAPPPTFAPIATPPPATTAAPTLAPAPVVAAPVLTSFPEALSPPPGPSRPWWRLAIFIPVAALVGAGVAVGRRVARDRGLIES